MDGFTEAELESARKVLRAMLGHPDPEPENSAVVPNEGRSTGTPRITPEQYARDFVARVTGRTPAHSEQLPEQD
jgi:hypothetical protein